MDNMHLLYSARKKEHNQYVQLKELFNRQRDLAVALSEKLRQRDETVSAAVSIIVIDSCKVRSDRTVIP